MIEHKISKRPLEYEDTLKLMEKRVEKIISGNKPELLWFLEHEHIYTAGTSAKNSDLINAGDTPVIKTGRGGMHTYHGPGQRVAYVMLDLKKRYDEPDIKEYVRSLEEWIIRTLAHLKIKGERRKDRIGIWIIDKSGNEEKIAAIGIRVRKWVTYHGIALNVSPDLNYFDGIIPCGIKGYGVTSLKKLGVSINMSELDNLLEKEFEVIFGE